jgi:LETM1 and EF-hand domain-containing protein 1
MELTLPFLIKLFPNMLPSQFDSKLQKEDRLRGTLRAKMELAKFLQDTISIMANDLKNSESAETVATAEELEKFIEAIRRGEQVNHEDIIRFAKLFNDEITLDNVSRAQLVAMCRYMNIHSYGTDQFLRYRLRSKLRQLKSDDRLIYWEGVKSLSMEELVYACQSRGIRLSTKAEMRKGLEDWIQLSLDKNIPSSLLILSRALTYTNSTVESEEAIKMALSSLPDDVVDEVSLNAPSREVTDVNVRKYESLKRQEKLIQEEEESKKKKKEKEEVEKKKVTILPPEPTVPTATPASEQTAKTTTVLAQPSPQIATKPTQTVPAVETAPATTTEVVKDDEEEKHAEKKEFLRNINEVIAALATGSSVTKEREELNNLINAHIETIGQTSNFTEESIHKLNRLNNKIGTLIDRLGEDIEKVDREIGTELKLLDKDNDGQITVQELADALQLLKDKPNDEMLQEIINNLDRDNDGKISVRELLLGLKSARDNKRDL